MNTNPDINRLSLEDRIESLENRLPSGGGVVGGWLSGGILSFNPTLIDSVPAGKVTKLPDQGGWFLWFTFDSDNSTNTPVARGLIWRFAMVFPEISGVVYSPTHIVIQLETKTSSGTLTQTNNYGNTVIPVTDSSFVAPFGFERCSWAGAKNLLHLSYFKIALCKQANTAPTVPLDVSGYITMSLDADNRNISCVVNMSKGGSASVSYSHSKATWVLLQPPGILGGQQSFGGVGSVMMGGFPYSAHGYTQWGSPWSSAPQQLAQFVPPSWR